MKKKIFLFLLVLFFYRFCAGDDFSDGVRYFNKRKYRQALKLFKKSIKENPEKIEINYYLGYCYYNLRNYDKAEKPLEVFLKNSEKLKVRDYYKIKRASDMLNYIYKRRRKYKKMIQLNLYLIDRMKNKEKFKSYLPSLRASLAYAYYNSGNSYFWKRDYKKAEEYFLKAKNAYPEASYIRARLAECLLNLGKLKEAGEEAVYVLENENKSWYQVVGASHCFLSGGVDFEKVKEMEGKFTDLSKKIINSYILLMNGDKSAFDKLYEVEKEKKTKGEITYNLLRKIYPEINPRTMDFYIEFFRKYPFSRRNEWTLDRIYSIFYRDKEKRDEIKKRIVKIIDEKIKENEKNPEVASLKYLRVKIYYQGQEETEEKLQEILKKYESIVEEYPESKIYKRILKEIASILKNKLLDYKNAGFYFDKLYQSGDINALIDLADCYTEEGKYKDAEKSISRYLEKKKGDVKGMMKLASLYLKEGKIDEGMDIIESMKGKVQEEYREKIRDIEKQYRQVGNNRKNKGFIEITEVKKYLTNFVSLDEKTPVIFRNEKEIAIGFISGKREEKNFKINFISKNRPSLFEPDTVFTEINSMWAGQWEGTLISSSLNYYKILPFRIIYRWQEEKKNAVKVKRTIREKDGEKTIEVEVSLPDGNWDMEIMFSYWTLRNMKILPEPDERYKTSILYKIRKKNFKVTLTGKNVRVYPEIILKKRVLKKEYNTSTPVINAGESVFTVNNIPGLYNVKFFEERIFDISLRRIGW